MYPYPLCVFAQPPRYYWLLPGDLAPLTRGRGCAQDSVPPRLQPPVVALRARVVRDVEGIDVALYRRAIMIRRKALAGVREAGKEGLPTFHVP